MRAHTPLSGTALQHWTGISTYNPIHWRLHNPYTRPWPEIQKFYAKSVGGKANSLLPAEGYTGNYYTTLG